MSIKLHTQLAYTPDEGDSDQYNSITILMLDDYMLLSSEGKQVKIPLSVVNKLFSIISERK